MWADGDRARSELAALLEGLRFLEVPGAGPGRNRSPAACVRRPWQSARS